MADTATEIQIPDRAVFKASEVCEIVKVQPYVLRSWEAEFPDLGVARAEGTGRVYRREDVQLALRIKHHVLVDGLTLAGVRRRLEEEQQPVLPPLVAVDAVPSQVRSGLAAVRQGLKELLQLLAGPAEGPAAPPAWAKVQPQAPAEVEAEKPAAPRARKAPAKSRRQT